MSKFEQIKERYARGFITDTQLSRYLALGVIDQEQYDEIYAIKHPVEEVVEEVVEPTEPTEEPTTEEPTTEEVMEEPTEE